MSDKKFTNKDMFITIKALLTGDDVDEAAPSDAELIEWCDKKIEILERKADKAREKAAEKKVAGDELQERIYSVLVDAGREMTADSILEALDTEGLSKQKIIARLSNLVKAGKVVKDEVRVGEAKSRRMAYIAMVSGGEEA